MPSRTTLPAIDPLDQLGLGRTRTPAAVPPPREPLAAPETPPAVPVTAPITNGAPATEAPVGQGASEASTSPQAAPVAKRAISPRKPKDVPALNLGQREAAPQAGTLHRLKVKFNARIPADLCDEVRNCVVALYASHRMTIDDLTTEALRRELERLKKSQNGGEDFPSRQVDPKVGRPVR